MKMNSKKTTHASEKGMKRFFIPMFIVISAIFLITMTACSSGVKETSPIDGVSDEVYKQLTEMYFYYAGSTDIVLGDAEPGAEGNEWFTEHDLMDEAEEYAEEHDIEDALQVFPNPLFFEYMDDPDAFSETEQSYIEKMDEFYQEASQMSDKYEELKEEWKDDLEVKDSDNIFDVKY